MNKKSLTTENSLAYSFRFSKLKRCITSFHVLLITYLSLFIGSISSFAQTWSNTDSMADFRAYHAAILLSNGDVLVTGGLTDQGVETRNCEIYSHQTAKWSSTGAMANGRTYHTLTLLPNGKALVIGVLCELYDPSTGTWSSTGSLNKGRINHTATLLSNGKVLVVGGSGSNIIGLNSCELYDPSTGTWSSTGSLNKGRVYHTATLLANNMVLVSGGDSMGATNSCELYNPANGKWSFTGAMAAKRDVHTATLLHNNLVLVTGGNNSCELYDPSTGTWSTTGSLKTDRFSHTATLLLNGKVLVTGGTHSFPNHLRSCELYEPSTGVWSETDSMDITRNVHTATLLSDGKVLITGGISFGCCYSNNFNLRNCELYSPCNNPTITIFVSPSDNTNTGGVATNIYLGYGSQSDTITANASGGSGFTYVWSPSAHLSASNIKNPVFTPTAEGNYTYNVTVTNSGGCIGTSSVTFYVKDIRVSGSGGKKVYLCHVPSGKNSKSETLSISTNAVSAHLANHTGDALGECGSSSSSGKRSANFNVFDGNSNPEITCSPNPFTGSFKFHYISPSDEKASILIYDMTGKLIEERYLSGYSNEIEAGKELSAGIYTVAFTQGSIVRLFKIIKTN